MNREQRASAVREALDALVFRHDDFRIARRRIDDCRASFGSAGEPECMLITGETGVGKTTLIQHYLKDHAPYDEDEKTVVPVLSGVISVPATMVNMATELLGGLDDPLADKGTLAEKTRRLRKLVVECGTEVIILDEFQHFIDKKSDRVILDVSDWLKNLISTTRIPVVLVGLPRSVDVLHANEQLKRRFSGDIAVRPFDDGRKQSKSSFEHLLKILDDQLEKVFGQRSNLGRLADRIMVATGGHIALIMKLTSFAAQHAARDGATIVAEKSFAYAFHERILKSTKESNPFSPNWNGQKPDLFGRGLPSARNKTRMKDGFRKVA